MDSWQFPWFKKNDPVKMYTSKHRDFLHAIRNNDVTNVSKLLRNGVDIHYRNSYDMTPLMSAMSREINKEIISTLLENNADVNAIDHCYRTSLMLAIQHTCDKDIITMIVNAGADINAVDRWGRTAVMYTTCANCMKNYCINKDNINTLLKLGANVKISDTNGNNILHLGICAVLISELVRYGATLEGKDNHGDTPLMTSVLRNQFMKAYTLLSLGSDPNCLDKNFNNPLHHSRSQSIANLLIYFGTDINFKNKENKKPLEMLIENRNYKTGLLIIKYILINHEDEINEHLKILKSKLCDSQLFFEKCRSELNTMKKMEMKENLTFYNFCRSKKTRHDRIINISDQEYLFNHGQIREIFPLYCSLIILRIKFNKSEQSRIQLLKNLEKIVFKPFNKEGVKVMNVDLNYDCIYHIGHYLNYKQILTLLLSSIDGRDTLEGEN